MRAGVVYAAGSEPVRPHADRQDLGDGVLRLNAADVRHNLPDAQRRPSGQVLGAEANSPLLVGGEVGDQPCFSAMAARALSRYACAPADSHWGKDVLTRRAPFSM